MCRVVFTLHVLYFYWDTVVFFFFLIEVCCLLIEIGVYQASYSITQAVGSLLFVF